MANNTTAAPIVVSPSEAWDGNDGPWSTFSIHVGTPPQPARVLISTALGETWVVSANKTQGGCLSADPTSCAQSRGALVNVNSSSTWQDQGIFAVGLELNLPDYVGNYDNGDYGLDTLGLGLPGSDGVSEPNMVVAALATKDYYLGYLGVTNHPTNFTQFDDPHPSLLSTLKQQDKIPSLAYAYSAGAQYRFKKVYGSLTLGGYDASKFIPNEVNFQFAADISRDLVVGLQSITFSDAKTSGQHLLNEGILTFIDSTVPHIWLPQDACTLFEDAFGITYNDTVNRYLVNDTLHEKLQSQNASVSFLLGNDINGGATVNITLPYEAFDLQVGTPIVNDTQYYFPLRRAVNDTQYTLGRTFLQESYLIVNYESSNFSVSQNVWVEDAPSEILAIRSVNSTSPTVAKITHKSGISVGTIVGIIVAVVVVLLLASGVSFFIIHRRRKRRKDNDTKEETEDPFRKAEMDGAGKPPIGELYAEGKVGEVDSSSKVEMQGDGPGNSAYDKNRAEIEGSRGGVEMEGTKGGVEMEGSHLRAEMHGDHLAPVELYAGPQGLYEMPSPNTSNSELPSPITPSTERRSTQSATWSRRQKPTPRVPDSESSDFSPDAETPVRRSGAEMWTSRRPRATPNVSSPSSDSRERHSGPSQRSTRLEIPSRSNTPMDVSSQSSSSRERQRNRGNALNRRMESVSTRTTEPDVSSQSRSSRERSDGAEQWNKRFGSTPRTPEASSPTEEPIEMVDRRRPSPLGTSSRSATPRIGPPSDRTPSPLPPGNFF